jgi:hypothetical protein
METLTLEQLKELSQASKIQHLDLFADPSRPFS